MIDNRELNYQNFKEIVLKEDWNIYLKRNKFKIKLNQ
jgi:hypothetical protein